MGSAEDVDRDPKIFSHCASRSALGASCTVFVNPFTPAGARSGSGDGRVRCRRLERPSIPVKPVYANRRRSRAIPGNCHFLYILPLFSEGSGTYRKDDVLSNPWGTSGWNGTFPEVEDPVKPMPGDRI